MITVYKKSFGAKVYDEDHTFSIIDKALYIYDVEDRLICVYADGHWAEMTIGYDEEVKPSGTTSPVTLPVNQGEFTMV